MWKVEKSCDIYPLEFKQRSYIHFAAFSEGIAALLYSLYFCLFPNDFSYFIIASSLKVLAIWQVPFTFFRKWKASLYRPRAPPTI